MAAYFRDRFFEYTPVILSLVSDPFNVNAKIPILLYAIVMLVLLSPTAPVAYDCDAVCLGTLILRVIHIGR